MELRVRSEAEKLLAAAHRDGCFWCYCCVGNPAKPWSSKRTDALGRDRTAIVTATTFDVAPYSAQEHPCCIKLTLAINH